ncbi:MAG: zinc-dependent metalloprotease [Acidimicrobiia bacterium]|nr:zinc-dependent metalloprotease [Acidimicrobiia bacterium]
MSPAGDVPDQPDNDPFKGVPIFGDLAKMLSQQGGMGWQAAQQFAVGIATGGASEANVEPTERIRIDQLARAAEVQVSGLTGLTLPTARGSSIEPVTRTTWTVRTLADYRPMFELLAGSLDTPGDAGPEFPSDDPFAQMMGPLMEMIGPMMMAMSAGSMVGHLAQRAFGSYVLPFPRPETTPLMVVPSAIDDFGEAWSLPGDDLRLWVCAHELAQHAVLHVPHVRARLRSLLDRYLDGFTSAGPDLEQRLGALDPTSLSDPDAIGKALGDPEVLLGAIRSPAQEALLPELHAIVAVVLGTTDHVVDRVSSGLMASGGQLGEALRRRRVEASDADRFVERLFGLELTQAAYDRARAFVDGVVERGGEDALARLWVSERELPTPPEIDAPGLWLARIDLPE